jgi:hypothetical protein
MALGDYETLAVFVLHNLVHLSEAGESFDWQCW